MHKSYVSRGKARKDGAAERRRIIKSLLDKQEGWRGKLLSIIVRPCRNGSALYLNIQTTDSELLR